MRVRVLEDDLRRVVVALEELARHDDPVEVTATTEASVTESNLPTRKIKTCPKCGSTGTVGGLFYESNPSYCKACTTKAINAHIAEINEATRTKAENHRQPWSELEVEVLLAAVGEGMHAADIAEMLGRTYLSVHGKLGVLRKLLAEGKAVTYAQFAVTTTTTTTVKVTRDPNYVGSQPDEDRWWEANYYTKGE